jgi:hypothetical protein
MNAKFVMVSIAMVILCASCKDDEPVIETPQREWTIIGYFNGNNNLDDTQAGTSYIIGDVQEMEHVGGTDSVTSIVMLSSLKTGGNAHYYKIEKANNQLPDQVKSTMLEDLGSKDMSDPQTLISFIKYAVDHYPANRYMLIIDSHGGGWYGLSPDEANGSGDMMSLTELRGALETGPHFDVVVFHACLMGMVEVAYEIKGLADYMVASEITMPTLSVLGADVWLKELVENPFISSFDLSKRIVQCVYDNGKFAQKTTHMAVTDLSKMDQLASDIANLGNKLTTEVGDKWNEVFEAWTETHYINPDAPSFTDLREFVKKLQQKPGLSQINYINQACNNMISSLNDACPFTKSHLENSNQPYGGITIHFPQQENHFNETEYKKLKFDETNWTNFLRIFIDNTQNIGGQVGENEVGFAGTVTYPGHTLSGYTYVFVYTYEAGSYNPQGYVQTATDGSFSTVISGITQPTIFAFEAIDDVNNSGSFDDGDGYGYWDYNGNNVDDDFLETQPGNVYSGITIVLEETTQYAVAPDGVTLRTKSVNASSGL